LLFHLPLATRNRNVFRTSILPLGSRGLAATRLVDVKEEIQKLIQDSEAFCFDVDSTVITEEGIDSLAAFKGVGQEVADLTKKAMGGHVLFQDALAERLSIIKPSKQDIQQYLINHPFKFTEDVEQLISLLHKRGKIVYLVSGGFRQMIEPVAIKLKIPTYRIYANNLLFHDDGSFKGFDPAEPTSRDGGKPAVVRMLIDAHGYKRIVMVGDGVTDMQARPPANLFIGYGGIVVRERVRDGADWYIYDFKDLIKILS